MWIINTIVVAVMLFVAYLWVTYSNAKWKKQYDIKNRLRRLELENDDLKEENKRLQERLIALGDEDEAN